MKCAPSRLTTALHIVQSLLPQMITHPWKYYSTMIDRVSIFEISQFCFSRGLQNWQLEHLQLILYCLDTIDYKCAYILFWQIYWRRSYFAIMKVFQCVLCELILHVFYVSVEMCFVLADAAVFCGAECSEEPLWWGGDASRVRRGYTDVPAKESAPTRYFPTKV